MAYHVYILTNQRNGTLYVGVTRDLVRRVHEHKEAAVSGFTERYALKLLVWFESTPDVLVAIAREKQLKNWRRAWKIALIEQANPQWRDLYRDLL